ncbi:DUF4240 domain-containing protein [Microvirga sp. STR05]|uniref:DUF4240 domain-containing protein n=1 Tax=Hymenobacter duratus TaxID=2771356 RepID=A0ABR8JI07_9BACT|nr:DUF4240 domain-containing protein [Hymenobacter duratus]MBD2714174.1 DUF4240 domain-containing protein [Hymenobacter duratus]MBR7949076.1 DUF4240 domain-containing protein [Microvirga sp. STR05]
MDKEQFWQLVEAAKTEAQGDQQLQEQILIDHLAQLEPAQIVAFECRLRECLLEADHFNIIAAQKIIDGYVSDDTYLYFRCWLIGQGETVFTNALQNADSLASVMDEGYQDFEELLYVATKAFEQRTGKTDEDDTFPRSIASEQGLDYDFGSETKGEDWTENQLPKMLPKLWKKFGAA